MSEGAEVPQAELEARPFPATNIPDKSVITSQISINSQRLRVNYDELNPYFDWIKEQAVTQRDTALLTKGARMTINNLKPGEEQWDEIVAAGEDEKYTLGRSIQEGTNTCFQRAVFFNLLMQQTGAPSAVMEGMWVESKRGDLRDDVDNILSMKYGGYKIATSDRSEGHLWNVTQVGEKHYLVDTSYLIGQNGQSNPVIQEIDYKPGDKYFRVQLSTGEIRHYIADGTVKVDPQQE